MHDNEQPVGCLTWNDVSTLYSQPGNISNQPYGSGTLIGNDLFLTAGHCFDSDNDPSGNPRTVQSFDVVDLVEYRLGGLDYAIVQLDRNPGIIFGVQGISNIK